MALLRKRIQSIETGEVRVEDWFLLTSAPKERLSSKALLKTSHEHWEIENSLHFVKDHPLKEDYLYSKRPEHASILAILRNLTVNLWDRDTLNKDNKPIQSLKLLLKPLKALQFLSSA